LEVGTGALVTVLPWPSAILLPVTPEATPAPCPMTVELLFPPSLALAPRTVELFPPAVAELPSAVALEPEDVAPVPTAAEFAPLATAPKPPATVLLPPSVGALVLPPPASLETKAPPEPPVREAMAASAA
jgi:hypothetical protein